MKQLPLLFALMSSRTSNDHKVVLLEVKRLLGDFEVKEVVLDYEAGMWTAIRALLPGVSLRGCVFHWVQAVYRKLEKGFAVAYRNDEGTHTFCRSLMALPFLQKNIFPRAFQLLIDECEDDILSSLCGYVEATWMAS